MTKTKKKSILKSIGKGVKVALIFLVTQIGNILEAVTITESSILNLLKGIFPALSPALSATISGLVISVLNAWKHKDDEKKGEKDNE